MPPDAASPADYIGPDSGSLLARAEFDRLSDRGRRFLGSQVAIMGGAMSWVSERTLVSAISNAGGFGVIAGGSMGPDALAHEIQVCLRASVGHVVLAGGVPSGAAVRAVKDGSRLVCFASALVLARRMVRLGADALVIEGSEAGGHIGPVSLAVLAQEILPHVTEVPVFVAGGIGRGEAILAFLEMGAAGAQLGTRFAAATESIAHPRFKQAFIHARARDALPSVQLDPRFPVIPVRGLVNAGTQAFLRHQAAAMASVDSGELTREQAQLSVEHFWAGALRRAVVDGDVEHGSVMAGQSVGMVTAEQPTVEIIAELVGQACRAISARHDAARH